MLFLNELKDLRPFNPNHITKTFKVRCTRASSLAFLGIKIPSPSTGSQIQLVLASVIDKNRFNPGRSPKMHILVQPNVIQTKYFVYLSSFS